MQDAYPRIQQAGAEVLVVSFAPPERVRFYRERHGWPFPIVSDPHRTAYRAFDLTSGSWWRLAGPRVIARYLWLMLRGRRLQKPHEEEDVKQLGGDFVLDREGRVVFAYRSKDPADRPPVDMLLEVINSRTQRR